MSVVKEARERFEAAKAAMSETHKQITEDLEFSNPSKPEQWPDAVRKIREGGGNAAARPCFTFDRTNERIMQVVNDGRQNKPGLNAIPVDSGADIDAAKQIEGMFRHIEYASRASIAYDTALELIARCGLGWLRAVPEVVNARLNEQEIRIKRVFDSKSVLIDCESTEPDGQDAMWGFVESRMGNDAFKRRFKKARGRGRSDGAGWFDADGQRVCEYFRVELEERTRVYGRTRAGDHFDMDADEYQASKLREDGAEVTNEYAKDQRKVIWAQMNGNEILEETEFPSIWIPLVPVYGYELFVEGKRHICGMTRRMMDGQRAYNYERSAWIESVALQPKAPVAVAWEGIENHQNAWNEAGTSTRAWLPYDHADENGNPIPAPQRLNPPTMPAAFAAGGQQALADLQASVGLHNAAVGENENRQSGRALLAVQRRGDTANFHFIDNLGRSIEQLGRIVVDMIPRVYDTNRQVRILGMDGQPSSVQIDHDMPTAVRKKAGKVVAINPGVGNYDVRVKVGPSYATQRQESVEALNQILQGSPQLMAIIGPLWAQMQDWPNADKFARVLLAMAPPQVQAAYSDESEEIPPAVKAQMAALEQQVQQMQQVIQQGGSQLQEAQQQVAKIAGEGMGAKLQAAQKELGLQQQIMQLRQQLAESSLEKDSITIEAKVEKLTTTAVDQIKIMVAQLDDQTQQIDSALNAAVAAAMPPALGDGLEPVDQAVTVDPVMAQMAEMIAQAQQTVDAVRAAANEAIVALTAPKRVIRDESGLAVGVEVLAPVPFAV